MDGANVEDGEVSLIVDGLTVVDTLVVGTVMICVVVGAVVGDSVVVVEVTIGAVVGPVILEPQ